MPASGERQLEVALRDLASALTATGAQWMIIGGIAVIARGVRRFTADIDAAIRGDEIQIRSLTTALAKQRIVPRIAGAEAFARESLVLLLRHEPSGVDFDVSLAWTDFEREAIAAATVESFGTVKAPMAQPADLIVFKSIAGRGKDLEDVTALLALYPDLDLARIRRRVHELATMADAPELGVGLETAIAAARNVVGPETTNKTKSKTKSKRKITKARGRTRRKSRR